MSGLCGYVHFGGEPADLDRVSRMAKAASHRGPDGLRVETQGEGAFAYLALHATKAGRKPQPLWSREGDICLVADLRLDNRQELISELSKRGFLEAGVGEPDDSEILLAAYRLWREGCAGRLLGDFAFVVWDRRINRLLCVRDPIGLKPFHYARAGALFCFASEAQQILAHPAVPRRLDELSVALYLAGWPPENQRTFFEGIHRLAPAHLLVVSPEGARLERYWDPASVAVSRSRADSDERFLETLQQSVADRLNTEGETVGIALSGGLDSSTIAALARRTVGSAGPPLLLGCSFIFETLKECDERSYICPFADANGLDVAFIDAEKHWLLSNPDLYIPSLESPFLSWQSCHEKMLQILRRRGARVLLTGHGADDLLRGSLWVFLDRVCRGDLTAALELVRTARSQGRKVSGSLYHHLLRPLLPNGLIRVLHRNLDAAPDLPSWIAARFARRTDLIERMRARRFLGPLGHRASHEIRQVSLDIAAYQPVVDWYDRNASRAGIEVRHPFLDKRLFELVLSLPPEDLYSPGVYKALLRRATVGILPETLRQRTGKTKMGKFIDFSLANRAAAAVEDLLHASRAEELGFVDGEALREAYKQYRIGSRQGAHRALWFAITLELWLRCHFSTQEVGFDPIEVMGAGTLALASANC
jgi:asparagine synthase (glutamine-hydrolysing)